jgi:hypothetical protein
MIQHDQQSRWKAWMRLLAVDIRPISYEHVAKVDVAFDRRHEPRYPLRCDATVGGAPDLRLALVTKVLESKSSGYRCARVGDGGLQIRQVGNI